MINYVGCSYCGAMGPYMCAGTFSLHPVMPIQMSPMGPYCGFCGPLAPMFRCSTCGTVQALYAPGMQIPQGMGTPLVAPVVQAPQGASQNQLRSGLKKVAMEFATSAAHSAGSDFGNQMSAWY